IKKLNEELKKSENLYRTLIEKNADMMTLAHPDGKVFYISPSLTNILGFTLEEFNSRPAFEFIHPDDLPGLMEQMMQIISVPGKSFFRQHRLLHKDGIYRWCEGTITNMLHDPDIGALVSNFRDINERKKAEDEIKKLNEELEQKVIERTAQLENTVCQLEEYKYFFINSNDFACIANMDGYFVTINPQFEKVLGYSKKELLENQFLKFIHPDDISATLKEVEKLKSGAITLNFVNRYLKKDGNYIWLEWSTYPDIASGKQYAIARDITERKKTDEQLLAVNNELEAFTYSVSHDLRAPLRAVNGYSEMLNEDFGSKLGEEGKRILDNIAYNATKMGTLIDELLSFSRLGRKDVNRKIIDMNELTDGVLSELHKNHPNSAKINIKKLHSVNADYGLLHQVMYNLLSNAVKYSSKAKKPLIEISSEAKHGEIIYSIKDNGAGFDMRYSDKLFGVFQRLHSQEEFEGTGVGLAIVQRVIAKHNGSVWAKGEVNKGATFNFSLPKN
ncbi:MAG TPA: PAS domain S-box protein, partial [Bacteroidia bacterium]|nr:PAS domain S-box protein [Bacteroidia bacterium]